MTGFETASGGAGGFQITTEGASPPNSGDFFASGFTVTEHFGVTDDKGRGVGSRVAIWEATPPDWMIGKPSADGVEIQEGQALYWAKPEAVRFSSEAPTSAFKFGALQYGRGFSTATARAKWMNGYFARSKKRQVKNFGKETA